MQLGIQISTLLCSPSKSLTEKKNFVPREGHFLQLSNLEEHNDLNVKIFISLNIFKSLVSCCKAEDILDTEVGSCTLEWSHSLVMAICFPRHHPTLEPSGTCPLLPVKLLRDTTSGQFMAAFLFLPIHLAMQIHAAEPLPDTRYARQSTQVCSPVHFANPDPVHILCALKGGKEDVPEHLHFRVKYNSSCLLP